MSANAKLKRPPLTHFLCLPLVNALSLPQLESSLATFKASIPYAPGRTDLPEQQRRHQQPRPLIPDEAIRPVGTLHLTLGVMSLPTPERLDEALEFFRSLDLSQMLRAAGAVAGITMQRRLPSVTDMKGSSSDGTIGVDVPAIPSIDERSQDESVTPDPFTISLESLHALPRARSATILHAAPVDHSSRLYPFCEALREKFEEAGFMQKEYKKGSTTKPRPLLLHATIANTIYIRGRKRNAGGHKKDRRASQYTFDARDVVSHYRNFYLNDEGTILRSSGIVAQDQLGIVDEGTDMHDTESHSEEDLSAQPASDDSRSTYPFVWARDFPIEAVCICEMGAKSLNPIGDESGMNVRLGEKYTVVAERSLDFRNINW
ncbi:hypothetical protein BJX64DRAFT_286803 [Aspergillus heterothallicus]